ncbi:unnamed protein product [Microthlaspi erraticum]|uniref:Uncharacterized protein n=1 Tax=Microthlaspi erraticum TaxID=1685480 RepID=A0A6D2L5M1_9BRAS|nr:unnamed protein product [Microthlaspi erraticum]
MEALLCSEIPIRSSINDLSSSSSSYTWPIIMASSSSFPTLMDKDNIPRFDWDLSLSAVVSSPSTGSDAIGAIEFDPSGEILATGGIARKIRSYRLSSLLESSSRDDHLSCICTPAKLSSLKWRPDLAGRVIGSGDYDGVVTEYDVERGVPVFERDEHGGRRIWSVDYTLYNGSVVGASGSDDGTVQMWDPRNERLEETVRPPGGGAPAAICSVEFDPFGGPSLAVGCADRNAYVYDIRRLVDPVVVLDGHTKTVTYARFMDQHTIVTGSTDGSLKLWDIANGGRVVRTCRGHVNSRNFVGMSVWRQGGLVVSGSENGEVFVYDKRWGEPVWVRGFSQSDRLGSDRRFVSSVCWRQVDEDWCTLVAGGSDGVLEIFSGQRS